MGVTDNEGHRHGFPQGTPQSQHHTADQTFAAMGQQNRAGNFPRGRPQTVSRFAQHRRNAAREEAGVVMTTAPTLFSFHDTGASVPGDHVLVYHANAYETEAVDNRVEIADLGWFAPDALPEGTTRGTRARILEALGQKEIDPNW